MVLSEGSEPHDPAGSEPRGSAPAQPLTSGRPKDAATLLIVRTGGGEGGGAARVLMGRRHRGHAYLPDKWVFPGGRLDRADFAVPCATELRTEVATLLERSAPPRRARALALAAIRETFEETGLLLARPAAPASDERPYSPAVRAGVWGPFLAAGALPDLAALDFVARAITPPQRTRRFDARFFMADAGALLSIEPGTGSGELDELAWFTWDEAAALDLPRITRGILAEAALWRADRTRPVLFHRVVNRTYRSDPL